jgi:hypothetical protein
VPAAFFALRIVVLLAHACRSSWPEYALPDLSDDFCCMAAPVTSMKNHRSKPIILI